MLTDKQLQGIVNDVQKELIALMSKLRHNKTFGEIPFISDLLYGLTDMILGILNGLSISLQLLTLIVIDGVIKSLNRVIFLSLYNDLLKIMYVIADRGGYDRDYIDIIDNIVNEFGDTQFIVGTFILFDAVQNYLSSIAEAYSQKTQQGILERIRTTLPNPDMLIRIAYIYPDAKIEVEKLLTKYGYSDSNITKMIGAMQNLPNEDQIRIMFWRGLYDEEKAKIALKRIGYNDDNVNNIITTWTVIPGPQDLLWMVGKEAFEPDMIARYGLDAEFPEEQSSWLSMQGLSRYWQDKYWYAHWDYPSEGRVLDLLHRGLLQKEDVYEYYRVVEIPPFWRELLMQASYKSYTRVDARRMQKLGVLQVEDLLESYRWLGYDDNKAAKMTEFTLKYNQSGDKRLTLTQVQKAYKMGLLSDNDTITFLIDNDYSEQSADLILKMWQIDIETEYASEVIDTTEEHYINNRINESEAIRRLMALELPQQKIEAYIAKWDLRKVRNVKMPSKEDCEYFYLYNIIDDSKYKTMMYEIGYSEEHIVYYLKKISHERMTNKK